MAPTEQERDEEEIRSHKFRANDKSDYPEEYIKLKEEGTIREQEALEEILTA